MRGGFSFKLSKNTDWPRIRVKHISAKMAFIRFGAPPKKRTPNGQAKRGKVVPPRRGSSVDVKTLASGLLSGGHSLLSLSNDTLKVEHPKFDVDEHGGDIKPEYVEYCLRDVQATWECYEMLITGAARLMLALAERRTKDAGLDWVFCDTDSIAIAKPDGMDPKVFIPKAQAICDAFSDLNPYERQGGSILQIEDQNYAADDAAHICLETAPPLYCFAISAKRYALYNEDPATGVPIIRKASAHGLGHLQAPYSDPHKKRRADRLKEINVDLWQEDLWKRIIVAAENPGQTEGGVVIDLEGDNRLDKAVASRYAATTPALLAWFSKYNWGKPYEAKVRPFNFLLSLQSEKMEQIAHGDPEAQNWWRLFKRDPAPTAPYDTDPAKAAAKAFDRQRRDKKIPVRWLKTYAAALSDYHLQPEPKFYGGDVRRANGQLRRRHVRCSEVQHIGKEADQWEEAQAIGEDDAEISYGMTPEARAQCVASLNGCTYTRYADDLSFSTNLQNFPKSIAVPRPSRSGIWEAGPELKSRISRAGFNLNSTKTRMSLRNSRQMVTGLIVNKIVNVPTEYIKNTRAMCDRLFRTGAYDYSPGAKSPTPSRILEPLHGTLSRSL